MFEAVVSKATILKKLIESLKDLISDVTLECTPEGISIQAMDASHVSLVFLSLRAENFEEYNCTEGQSLGISIANLSKVMKCGDNDDQITLRAESNASMLSVIFQGKEDDRISEFHLNLLSLDSEQMGIPEEEYPAVITMPSEEFSRVCRELSQLSDTLNFEANKEKVTFSVKGDIGKGAITLKHRPVSKKPVNIEVLENVSCSYAMRYLSMFNKASSLSEQVIMCSAEDKPLILHFQFEMGEIKYYLAPKVQED